MGAGRPGPPWPEPEAVRSPQIFGVRSASRTTAQGRRRRSRPGVLCGPVGRQSRRDGATLRSVLRRLGALALFAAGPWLTATGSAVLATRLLGDPALSRAYLDLFFTTLLAESPLVMFLGTLALFLFLSRHGRVPPARYWRGGGLAALVAIVCVLGLSLVTHPPVGLLLTAFWTIWSGYFGYAWIAGVLTWRYWRRTHPGVTAD